MLSKQLISLRNNKGISQEELANELGVSRQAISKWETDHGYPETENLLKLVSFYKTSADYILFGNDPASKKESIWEDKNFVKALTFFGMIFSIISITALLIFYVL